jgi:hypothetical protein
MIPQQVEKRGAEIALHVDWLSVDREVHVAALGLR